MAISVVGLAGKSGIFNGLGARQDVRSFEVGGGWLHRQCTLNGRIWKEETRRRFQKDATTGKFPGLNSARKIQSKLDDHPLVLLKSSLLQESVHVLYKF